MPSFRSIASVVNLSLKLLSPVPESRLELNYAIGDKRRKFFSPECPEIPFLARSLILLIFSLRNIPLTKTLVIVDTN